MWTCFLCKVVISKHISRHLSLQNKNKEIVEEDVSKLQWIRCHTCFRSFHLSCLARIHGTYFDKNVIFATKPFNCVICAAEGNKSAGKFSQHDSLDFSCNVIYHQGMSHSWNFILINLARFMFTDFSGNEVL